MTDQRLNHLAIIMDGNGRWAQKRHLPRVLGHRQGMENVRTITLAAQKLGIKVLSLYAFSTENWARPHDEVNYLMQLPIRFFDRFMPELMANKVRVNIMGYLEELPAATYEVVKRAMATTAKNDGLVLNFAFNYGARREIVSAVKQIATQVAAGNLEPDAINEDSISRRLMTAQFGEYSDPDLLIRTSGEERLSNFMLWQLAYSELTFSSKYWPDFTAADLTACVKDFYNRDRRYGKISKKELR